MCQKGAAGAKEARRDRPWKGVSLPALHSLSLFEYLPNIHKVAAGWQGDEFTSSHRDPGRNLQSWWPLQQPGGWEHGTKVLLEDLGCPHLCTSCEVFKLYDSKAVRLWRIKQVFQLSVMLSVCQYTRGHSNDSSCLCLGEQEAKNAKASPSYSRRSRRGICCSYYGHLPNTIWEMCRRSTDEGCCSCDSEKKKAQVSSAQMLITNWSPTGQVRKASYFGNPVQRKTLNMKLRAVHKVREHIN